MKVMVTWSAKSGQFSEAVTRFLTGQAAPPVGLTLLGRWHSVDIGSGFVLFETDNAEVIYENSVRWADILDIRASIVVEDSTAAPILAEKYKQ